MSHSSQRGGGSLLSAVLLTTCCLLGGATAQAQESSADKWSTADQHSLVPAYFAPTSDLWHTMCKRMNRSKVGSTAVMNPSNGPGLEVDPAYLEVIEYCHDKGQNVVGYTQTAYGTRSKAQVKADVDAYYAWYPEIDGIFFTEMSNDEADADYYAELYDYVKNVSGSGGRMVIGNPGAAATTDWQLVTPVVDRMVVFQGTDETYLSWTAPDWVDDHPASDFAHLVYGTADVTAMDDVCDRSKDERAGSIFVTNDTLPNQWDTLGGPLWKAQTPVKGEAACD